MLDVVVHRYPCNRLEFGPSVGVGEMVDFIREQVWREEVIHRCYRLQYPGS